ncbi:von Willebrand factor C domain-containing protein 2-like [Haliotis rufescens]|uniref:von Willebrand factor C domain-containing protein 2-like n=1 Tax=Haliotis rufescens TaxID=6454 RepID=UPI00201F033D|nr:von Willebrand factor C domain-containing protein 2-like [Haliotis rufescens]
MIYMLALVAIPTVVMAADYCMFLGKQYAIDEQFHPSPCQVCLCVAPSVACTTFDCPPVMCVDSVQKKGECCRTCPNGHNCQHGGHVIKHGEVYRLGNGTQCQCNINPYQHSPNAQGTFTDALCD